MANEDEIRRILDGVLVPGAMRGLAKLNLVRQIEVADGRATISITSTALSPKSLQRASARRPRMSSEKRWLERQLGSTGSRRRRSTS